ncbi:MAG: hypothetical protein OQJ97_02290 [Rhodospirillales bacterium]|nr:hypothetical protein [Rhodospirillales bacterium]
MSIGNRVANFQGAFSDRETQKIIDDIKTMVVEFIEHSNEKPTTLLTAE